MAAVKTRRRRRTRKEYTDEEKVQLVTETLRRRLMTRKTVNTIAKELHFPPGNYWRWRRQFPIPIEAKEQPIPVIPRTSKLHLTDVDELVIVCNGVEVRIPVRRRKG